MLCARLESLSTQTVGAVTDEYPLSLLLDACNCRSWLHASIFSAFPARLPNTCHASAITRQRLQAVFTHSKRQTPGEEERSTFESSVFIFIFIHLEAAVVSLHCLVEGVHFALRPQKRDGLLGTERRGGGDKRVKARPRIPPEKDRRDRGPPPEQRKCLGGVPSPLPSD